MTKGFYTKRLFRWILFFAVGLPFFQHFISVINRSEDYFFAKEDFPVRSIFLNRYDTVGALLASMIDTALIGLIAGVGVWLYEIYWLRKYTVETSDEVQFASETKVRKGRSFWRWILVFAIGFNLLFYAVMVMSRFNDWLFIDPDFVDKPALPYIFLIGFDSTEELSKHKLFHAIVWSFVGIAGWIIERYYVRRQ